MQKIAFITGISGQDGAYLSQLLLSKNYKVYGGVRKSSSGSLWRLMKLGIDKDIEMVDFELSDLANIWTLIEEIKPDEFYNLAAQSHVGCSFKTPLSTIDTTGIGAVRIITGLHKYSPKTKYYQASSSELFGKATDTLLTEKSPFHPISPYGVAKQLAHSFGINYRESHNMHISNGILFNHESPLRGETYVTKKITDYVARYSLNKNIKPLELGNMNAKKDWGHAKDYVKAMYLMLQQNTPDDYIIATGKLHSVRELVETAFKYINKKISWEGKEIDEVGKIDGKIVVKINKEFFRPIETDTLNADCSKANKVLGWKPEYTFEELVKEMVEDKIKEIS